MLGRLAGCFTGALLLGFACSSQTDRPAVQAPASWQPAINDFVDFSGLTDPLSSLGVTIEEVDTCTECYEVVATSEAVTIRASDVLGAQYGLAAWLESQGVRFVHPHYTHTPDKFTFQETTLQGEPDIRDRGLHLHTLHPIEALFDFWTNESDDIEGAKRSIDWLVKNRGNTLAWPALDDINDPERYARWYARTKSIIDYGHSRGVEFSMGVQLFSSGNLQRALHLVDVDSTPADQREDALRERLRLLKGLGLDDLGISFGEFFQEEPDAFIALAASSTQIAIEELDLKDVHATVHVGEDLRTDYMDENLIYYFLIKYVPNVTPWVHTVMYYNLTDPASGAYHHENFHEHRDFLYEKIRAGEDVTYFPESAYWVAFDINVPMYLPLYPLSRWLDLKNTRDATGSLPTGHVIFSSGWEWGYWQTDLLALQASYELPETFEEQVRRFWSAWSVGEAASDSIIDLAESQRSYLLEKELGGYFAGWDSVLELGSVGNIVSQPLVTRPHRLARTDAVRRGAFESSTLEDMTAFAETQQAALESLLSLVDHASLSPVLRELVDGCEITALRTRYVETIYRAAVLGLEGGAEQTRLLDEATSLRERARQVVERRKEAFWYPRGESLVSNELPNPTIYPYGYLWPADTLCYWEREMIELTNQLGKTAEPVPECTIIDLDL